LKLSNAQQYRPYMEAVSSVLLLADCVKNFRYILDYHNL
jgi:hypothetical protein